MVQTRRLFDKLLLSGFMMAFSVLGVQLAMPVAAVYAADCPGGAAKDAAGHCPSSASGAINSICQGVNGASGTSDCGTKDGNNQLPDLVRNVINILLFIIGLISVIMIIVGGIRYVVSNGDQKAITDAKNTILYAVVGVIVAILAYSIVNFVVGSL